MIYQVYLRSFADGNGDGVGDLAGLRQRLPHLAELGVDAIWLNPWYPSPMADAGYDVADHRDIEPTFGTLAEAEKFVEEAHAAGIRVVIDLVPNHSSTEHTWFVDALAGGPGCAARELFWFRPGRGPGGELPPNGWQSRFGGPAWTRVTERDGTPGEWYLHLYSPQQPDLNWTNPAVRAEFEDILRFWLDRDVDGFRIDVADGLVKADGLPEVAAEGGPLPYSDQDGVHEIYRSWRRIADGYGGRRVLVGELWLPDSERFARYLRPDELHSAFNFDFLCCAWDSAALRGVIDATLAAHAPVGAAPTWVLSNHDVTRHVTRYGRADTSFDFGNRQHGAPTDRPLGTRRARAALLLTMALPGGAYVYQGEELGLWEVEDLPDELRQDPVWVRSGHTDRGRDGCRVPVPWGGAEPPFEFSPADATAPPWLPQPADWHANTTSAQAADPTSMLALYRAALRLRRAEPGLGDGDGELRWSASAADGVLAFDRPPGLRCVVNLSPAPIPLPANESVLLASAPLAGDRLPPDTAAWLRVR
ncbi:glycoside hydrolase family 13 protein [Solihabitans fulvus]|uniref:Glycoside hydrolase family 13 protein n=1 Tax=Solihabitans fulvus TaxID=1892852 RepID=A0A5B2WY69_9PSEU|nr:glycoside hydrolase family 13 protein [Solihabitans fulvus]